MPRFVAISNGDERIATQRCKNRAPQAGNIAIFFKKQKPSLQ